MIFVKGMVLYLKVRNTFFTILCWTIIGRRIFWISYSHG